MITARTIIFLAWRDLCYGWRNSLCFLAAVVGVVLPMMLVLALKQGMLDSIVEGLVEDSKNREIITVGTGRFSQSFFDEVSSDPRVEFIVPATRKINLQIDQVRNPETRQRANKVTVFPSGPRDPLLGADVVLGDGVALTERLSSLLNVQSGDSIELIVRRRLNGVEQVARTSVPVVDVVRTESLSLAALFAPQSLLLKIERFKDDAVITIENWQSPVVRPETYVNFRLYVKSLRDVAPVIEFLESEGHSVRARTQDVPLLLAVQGGASVLFSLISVIAIIGFWASLSANIRSSVEHQRLTLSTLIMLGGGVARLQFIPFIQALILVIVGLTCAVPLLLIAVQGVNYVFSNTVFGQAAFLHWSDFATLFIVGIATAVLATIWAARSIHGISPEEVFRKG